MRRRRPESINSSTLWFVFSIPESASSGGGVLGSKTLRPRTVQTLDRGRGDWRWSRSRRPPIVEAEQTAESLSSTDAPGRRSRHLLGVDQLVLQPLVVALPHEMGLVLGQRSSERR